MKQRLLTTSEFAQMVINKYPALDDYRPNFTEVLDVTGNPVVQVQENPSGNSKVNVKPYLWKGYGQLNASQKREAIELIENLKVEKITAVMRLRNGEEYTIFRYYVAGDFQKRGIGFGQCELVSFTAESLA